MKWTMFTLVCVACLIGLSVLFLTIPEESHQEAAPIVDVPLDVAAAEEVYTKSCLMCHGDQLQGTNAPKLSDVGARLSQVQIANKINRGGSGMPGFQDTLSAEEVGNLAKWLSEMK